MTRALYNEINRDAAAQLQNLINAGLIAPGDVACCDVRDLRPRDLAGYNQVHLYAGVGIWSYGLRAAGIPDTANVWTFSEPCQPFSAAGKQLGFADERYLRPYTHHLVSQCRPHVCLGEQVASKDGLAWLDVVFSDLENAGYAFGPSDTCSAGFGAPHIRQRLRFAAVRLADAIELLGGQGRAIARRRDRGSDAQPRSGPSGDGEPCGLADAHDARLERWARMCSGRSERAARTFRVVGKMANADANRFGSPAAAQLHNQEHNAESCCGADRPGPVNGFWANADWLHCRDDKWRPVEPGTFPLAHGLPRSLGTASPELRRLAGLAGLDSKSLARAKTYRIESLREYGNAVDVEATIEFCRVVGETLGLTS